MLYTAVYCPSGETITMHVQLMHQGADGVKTDLGPRELSHMPPIGEPFPIDETTCFAAKAYFGPDEQGNYLLVLEGSPVPRETYRAG